MFERDFLYGVWLKKKGHDFCREVANKTKKITFTSSHFPLFLSFLTLFLSLPIPLNLPSPDAFVVPTTTLCTMYYNLYMGERDRFELHLPRLEPGTTFNSKYFSPGARGPRLFSVIVNYANVYSYAMGAPVRFVKWLTQVVLV